MSRTDLVIGYHAVEELLKGDRTVSKVFINQKADSRKVGEIRALCKAAEAPLQMVPIDKLNRMSRANHQGIVALISPIDFVPLEESITRLYEKGEPPRIVVADGITDIKNIGAIARSCMAFGVHLLIMGTKANAEIGEGAIKASAGTLLKLPVCRVSSLAESLDYLKSWGLAQVAASEKSDMDISQIDKTEISGFALWMGNEDRGLSKERLSQMDHIWRIPMQNDVDSLNVSVAAGICLYELTS